MLALNFIGGPFFFTSRPWSGVVRIMASTVVSSCSGIDGATIPTMTEDLAGFLKHFKRREDKIGRHTQDMLACQHVGRQLLLTAKFDGLQALRNLTRVAELRVVLLENEIDKISNLLVDLHSISV